MFDPFHDFDVRRYLRNILSDPSVAEKYRRYEAQRGYAYRDTVIKDQIGCDHRALKLAHIGKQGESRHCLL